MSQPEHDPCYQCSALGRLANGRPYCQRGAHYGQAGCLRNRLPAQRWQPRKQPQKGGG